MASRRLNLHVSALNDAEYKLYTTSLADITLTDSPDDGIEHDDAYFENISVSVREARAWLRGRYSHIQAAMLDNILRFFSPNLSQTDMLSGGQFFAALRLVVHVESGKDIDRALAFVQARPSASPTSRPGSPSKPQAQVAQASFGSSRRSSDSTNPFSAPPQHRTLNTNHNPFSSARSVSAKSHDGAADSASLKLPPLPPRKPAPPIPGFQPPPRHGSFASSTSGNPPPPPPKPMLLHSHTSHITSALMKQSLIASKNGKTWKQAEEQLEKERVLRVLKSSESSSSSTSNSYLRGRSSSPNKMSSSASSSSYTSSSDNNRAPPLPKRNNSKKPPSPSMSTSSFQQVALAGKGINHPSTSSSHNPFKTSQFQPTSVIDTPRYANSPSTSPVRPSIDLPSLPGPPPKHPDQNYNPMSYRKPPPPIPPNLSSATIPSIPNFGHKRMPSFNQLRHSPESLSNDNDERGFEEIYGSKPKTASPYVSTFSKGSIDLTPARIREETASESPNYFNGNLFADNSPSPSRMFRSKSLHHPSPTSLASRLAAAESGDSERSPFSPLDDDTPEASPGPSPASRRKRPESVQVLGSKTNVLGAHEWSPPKIGLSGSPSTNSGLSRHMSLSTPSAPNDAVPLRRHQRKVSGPTSGMGLDSSSSTSDSPLKSLAASLQPQLLSMQQQLQPHLDKARFKAEAGLSKRGFVRDHKSLIRPREEEEALMRDGRADGWEQQSVEDDDSYEEIEDYMRNRQGAQEDRTPRSMSISVGVGGVGSRKGSVPSVGIEKDNLKWPVGEEEGWRPL
ncbi:hypothetical protein J3R30DRAFT_1374642 [Lentinula aciculospora]|uniref:Uncharacterized protein n=1 Tax=Lentinula aciculospora TaxID=153920 RepID=A0A9W9APX6_9AGAR|nr:hypothetical protein J3R30DRAFT_1374642 [Lentinula aciculospora]